jgi:hypothetical protein
MVQVLSVNVDASNLPRRYTRVSFRRAVRVCNKSEFALTLLYVTVGVFANLIRSCTGALTL